MSAPYYADESVTLHHGDCVDILRELPDASVDAVCTDPPYGLEFMGNAWDSFGTDTGNGYREKPRITDRPARGGSLSAYTGASGQGVNHFEAGAPFQRWCTLWSTECLRVLKPGGHMLAFGGTRTWHRLACAVEDAGFEVRDSIAWLYGSGFPKSLNLVDEAGERTGWGTALKPAFEPIVVGRKPLAGTVAANVQAHGTGVLNIDGCRVGDEPAFTDRPGRKRSGGIMGRDAGTHTTSGGAGRWPANVILDDSQSVELDRQSGVTAGGASRFFPTFRYEAKAPTDERPQVGGVSHPTVKPLDLMRWLVRLVTPPGGVVLEPFAGSGTTAEACVVEGFRCIAIERESDYLPLIVARLTKPIELTLDFGEVAS